MVSFVGELKRGDRGMILFIFLAYVTMHPFKGAACL